ncbi:MAG: aminotransferase class I/II-fold pyridoxal phosphate-dependent enzyme [Gammaproteobacteria bacterium]|nr:aminotransferase class I/II-fold pyridoxal phosphate-dependent enzyme [Gammaproteobacteria bacterium]MBQ0839600.1 aminotransferase class I/II-fold pyridoxal phosphate-dependent enzyme [Gammaproteobacteria bacterium]
MTGGIHRQYASRIEGMTSFKVVDFLEAAVKMEAQGRDIVRMEAGEPAFPTAPAIIEAAKTALADEKTFYTPSLGIIELREAIANFYDTRYGLNIPAQRIVVTTGSSAALGLICDLIINPGDGLQLTDPGYPCNANFVRRAGGEPQLIPVDARNAYQLSPELVAEHWRDNTVGVLVASPSNPTGEMLSRDNQRGINQVVSGHNGVMIMDELYHGLVYDQQENSILEINDDAMVINSFSKYFGMTGWRLGWMVVPEDALEAIKIMAQNFYISPPSISQYAAIAAFEPATIEIMEARRAEFRQRRDYLVPALRELGFSIPHTPAGAFYIYAGIEKLADDSEAFCWDMLERAGVAFTPGTDFGEYLARQHVRFSYTQPLDRLELAVERLGKALAS